jgi:hypothetical protein
MTVEDSDITLASAPYNNGKFTLTLPESLGRQYLSSLVTSEEGLTVSNPDAKAEFVILYAYESGSRVGSFYHGTRDWMGILMYVDGDTDITGSYSYTDYSGVKITETFNHFSLTGGWNIVYVRVTRTGSSYEYEYTTQVPAGAKWYFIASEEDDDDDDDEYTVIQNSILTVALENPASYSGKIDAVKLEAYYEAGDEYIVVASADYNSRGHTLISLPSSLDSKYLYGLLEVEERTVSDPDLKMRTATLSAYKSGYDIGYLYYGTENYESELIYADRDASITGYYSGIDDDGIKREEKYSMYLKEGWNMMYIKTAQKTGKSYEYEYTTQAPKGAKWYFNEYGSSTSAALHKQLRTISRRSLQGL